MEPTAADTLKENLGTVIGSLAIAALFIASKWQSIIAFIRNKPKTKPIGKAEVETMINYSRTSIEAVIQKYPERVEVENMIKEHDAAATSKTELLISKHEKGCMQCMDSRFREQAELEREYRRQESEDRKEFRREMLATTQRIHDRIDALAEKK